MRYVIGAKIPAFDGSIDEGICCVSNSNRFFVLDNDIKELHSDKYTMVFTDVHEAEEYVKTLSKLFRKEFRSRAKKFNLDMSQFRFYLLKVDSKNFRFKILEENTGRVSIYKKHSSLKFHKVGLKNSPT